MKTVLITGGAGFIGSHVAESLRKSGFSVVVLDDLSGGFEGNIPADCLFEKGSITDVDFLNAVFTRYSFDYVFHLAAYAAEGLSHFIKRFNYENNLIGSVNLINAAVNAGCVKCFVFTSSIAVYGQNQTPMMESLVPCPEDPYGIAKFAVEMDLREAHEMFGLNYIIFRPHNVYGDRQNIADPYRNVIGIFMRQILENNPITIFGDGQQKRAFSYISDVAPIIAKSIDRPETWNTVYNVGADQPWTVLELATQVCKSMGQSTPNIQFLNSRNEVQVAYSSHEKIKRVFGDMIENVPLGVGIQRMADWVKSQRHFRPVKIFQDVEVRRNMPASWARLLKRD